MMTTITKRINVPLSIVALLFSASACSNSTTLNTDTTPPPIKASDDAANSAQKSTNKPEFTTKEFATFNEPWAMAALPKTANDPLKLLVTQKTGELFIVDTQTSNKTQVDGVPSVAYGGQGGLGDIVLAPDFATSKMVYISYVEAGDGPGNNTFGAKVVKAKLVGLDTDSPSLQAITPIWQQTPKVKGQGHYSHRLLFSPDGQYLYISSGERQKKDPSQDMTVNLGKIIRLNADGSVPKDNPFAGNTRNIASQFWTIGHRNVLGMAFDESGRLWVNEMGPRGGDEFNLIKKGNNYGWPVVSNGRNYSGTDIPDHDTRPEFEPPKITWTPVISPSSMSIYSAGNQNNFPEWQGDALMSGLSSKALIVVDMKETGDASERYRYDMGARIRNVLTVDGEVWVLEDGDSGRLLQLLPK
ncbi:PQQ-dependent sugar dehydrogenase [Psychrobacter sp. 1U1]|uniref:PQQ-dependent sugar dehydrogenase n=1 Tax=Psychrobacter sp. 1U1 TaxID=3453576 RepID=UPI003F4741B2